jgi:hypothetical protein
MIDIAARVCMICLIVLEFELDCGKSHFSKVGRIIESILAGSWVRKQIKNRERICVELSYKNMGA